MCGGGLAFLWAYRKSWKIDACVTMSFVIYAGFLWKLFNIQSMEIRSHITTYNEASANNGQNIHTHTHSQEGKNIHTVPIIMDDRSVSDITITFSDEFDG